MALHDVVTIRGFADPFSSLSHLAGAVVFAALGVPLVRKGWCSGGPKRALSLTIFAASAVALLSLSGAFHLLPRDGTARGTLQRLDHAAIFLLIAATFTPVQSILFRGPWRWGMLTFIWTVAVTGITLKTIYFTSVPLTLGVAAYVAMGWVGALSIMAVARRSGLCPVLPLLLGGLVYSAGAVVEWAQPAPLVLGVVHAHEVFHVAVLTGLGLHWRFMWTIADAAPLEAEAPSSHFQRSGGLEAPTRL